VAHIESAGCKAQQKSVIGAHNRCWKYLIGAISTHHEATRDLEFIGEDKDRQIKQLWTETRFNNILPWDEIADEAERLLASDQANRQAPDDDHVDKEQENDQVVDRDETDPYIVCVFYYCRTYYKAVRVGGGGEWRTCDMRDDEPRPVWMSLLITH
jgi:hypothetical protein